MQNLLEHLSWDGDLRHLEDDIASVAHHLRADLDQLLLQARQRPVLDRLRCRKRAEKVAKIVGERMKLEPHGVGRERPARQPCPLDRALAFLDPLFAPVVPENSIRADSRSEGESAHHPMRCLRIVHLLATFIADLFKPPRRLEVENLFLRHQLNVALRGAPHRPQLRGSDRALLVWMTRLWPSLLSLSRVVQPDTFLRCHRSGFRAYWRWKSRGRPGRPRVSRELRELIQRMSKENSLWGAPRIHGELLKLGFEIAESTVSKYMIRRRGPPSQTWR